MEMNGLEGFPYFYGLKALPFGPSSLLKKFLGLDLRLMDFQEPGKSPGQNEAPIALSPKVRQTFLEPLGNFHLLLPMVSQACRRFLAETRPGLC